MKRRGAWLEMMAKRYGWTLGAEIGVWYGQTFFHLLDTVPGLVLFGVDIWTNEGPAPSHHTDQEANRREVLARVGLYGGRAAIIEKPSLEAAKRFDDASLDFVFIDADHSFAAVCDDIKAWSPKVKPGGFVTGHDYDWAEVREAVDLLVPDSKVDDGSDFVWYSRRAA
jgi:predicted O-methyltransferase YrrM